MTLRFFTDRRGPFALGCFFAVFLLALAVPAFILALQPSGEVAGQGENDPPPNSTPDFIPEISLRVDRDSLNSQGLAEEDAGSFAVIVGISPTLHPNHDYARCQRRTANPCVEGGVVVFDSYNEHESNGNLADELIAFIFFGGREAARLSIFIDDECITPNRTIRVRLNSAFVGGDYGYTIDGNNNEISVRVKGNDETNGGGCPSIEEGATEVNGGGGNPPEPEPADTHTPIPTVAPTATASPTPTKSPTIRVDTEDVEVAYTLTPTPSVTPTGTATSTPTPTGTATPTPTPTPTATATPTATPEPTQPPEEDEGKDTGSSTEIIVRGVDGSISLQPGDSSGADGKASGQSGAVATPDTDTDTDSHPHADAYRNAQTDGHADASNADSDPEADGYSHFNAYAYADCLPPANARAAGCAYADATKP